MISANQFSNRKYYCVLPGKFYCKLYEKKLHNMFICKFRAIVTEKLNKTKLIVETCYGSAIADNNMWSLCIVILFA